MSINRNMALSSTPKSATELIYEAKKLDELLNKNDDDPVKTEVTRILNTAPEAAFIYLVSSSWFDIWKELSGYDNIKAGIDIETSNLTSSKVLPKLNDDLVDWEITSTIQKLSKLNPKLAYLDIVLKKGIIENEHFIYVTHTVWKYFKMWYPDSIEVKRQAYKNAQEEICYEIHGHLVLFVDF